MLDNRSLVVLSIYFNCIATEYTIYSNGWVPVTRDHVYNQIHTKWTENIIYPSQNSFTGASNNIKLLNKEENKEKVKEIDENGTKLNFDTETKNVEEHEFDENITNAPNIQRKAKKMIDLTLKKYDDVINVNNLNNNEEILTEKTENDLSALVESSNTYEVTEDTYSINTERPISNEVVGYYYTSPNPEIQNLSSVLTATLSKYNIRTDDKLLNYDLSRQIKTQTPKTNVYNVWNPYRTNSLNHLAVDPLLAVFLSNYGIYLPSLYGIKSNYNNLYGYLASNNIHNNRPFGLYKISSDTDSWN